MQITTSALSETTIEKMRQLVELEERDGIFEVSHPRQKLESFFLSIVEEAQAKNVRTYGVRAAGEMPSFLETATRTPTEAVVDSLVAAASRRSEAVTPAAVPAATPPDDSSRRVVEELVSRTEPGEPKPAESRRREPAPSGEAERPRPQRSADTGLIDSLMQRDNHSSDEKDAESP
jgi:hypothetical protein